MTERKEGAPSQFQLRNATIDDIPQIKELLLASWKEHSDNEPEILSEESIGRGSVEDYYQEGLSSPNSFIKVAEINGQFAGFFRADIKENDSRFKHLKILWLDDIVVKNEFKRKGTAQYLIKNLEIIINQNNIKQIQARVYAYNNPMQSLLKSAGYHSPHSLWIKTI